MNTIISIPEKVFREIRSCLLPQNMQVEEVGFLFADVKKTNGKMWLEHRDWYHVQPTDYEIQSASHVELNDGIRPRIIKHAHDLGTSIVEIHSHLGTGPAQFSSSDLYGFAEFVPHVRWRLGKKPYVAIVLARVDFDALVWVEDGLKPTSLNQIVLPRFLWKKRLRPNGLTLRRRQKHDIQ